MKHLKNSIGVLAVLMVLLPFASSCASQKALQDYKGEVRTLREERTQLKKENRGLRLQLDSYEVALADANSRLEAKPEPRDYPGLDALGVDYGTRGGNFVISLPSEITFPSGKADLTSKGKEALRVVAATLMGDHGGGEFWITGHTDNDPIRKSKWNSNRELSVFRAMAVLHYLVEESGVPDDQCVVAGHGEYMPLTPNDSATGKARNRRVEIVVRAPGN
jgi:chemotaxis protein MotB